MITKMCICIKSRNRFEQLSLYKNTLDSYKSTLDIQNIYTINRFIHNIELLYNDVKKAGYYTLLREIEQFQSIVKQNTYELVRFHTEMK